MSNFIYSKTVQKGIQSFYLVSQGKEYFLFSQRYYKGVKRYFHNQVHLSEALDFSNSHMDTALIRTKRKLPMYIEYIEKEYEIIVLNKTVKKNNKALNRKYNYKQYRDLEFISA